MRFIKRESQSHVLKVAGAEYPAIYSMQAIAHLEEYTETHHLFTQQRLEMDVLTAKEVIGYCYGMMAAAGVEVDVNELAASISPADSADLIEQIKKIVTDQKSEPIKETKNAKTPAKK